jgi:hypothetical protein
MRQKIQAQAMRDCITGHLTEDLTTASDAIDAFLDLYDLPAAVLLNLQGARRALQSANHFMAAACLVAERGAI